MDMMKEKQGQLNLSRKWRSKNFDQIVGQDISVGILKNSLFLDSLFPVYLFSGQRGCGKTSLARIFSSAINCSARDAFQKNPKKQPLPCLVCNSCIALLDGRHPDFFEIDAASHTGVDTIRQIIDSAHLLPLMGRKKVYLIDEAHMLSKASFNALLKILEEPPQSVLFILATTEVNKIIETVRSRCFQLFFKPIEKDSLRNHIQYICKEEDIQADVDGVQLIVDETGGSARDAINLLEQVRFSSSVVNKESVLQVLGYVSDEDIIALLQCVVQRDPSDVLKFLKEKNINQSAIGFVWNRFVALVRALIWLKHGVTPQLFTQSLTALKKMSALVDLKFLNVVLEKLYDNEILFGQTALQYELFEMILVQLSHKQWGFGGSNSAPPAACSDSGSTVMFSSEIDEDQEDDDQEQEEEGSAGQDCTDVGRWKQFITHVAALHDPLLLSVCTQGQFVSFDAASSCVVVQFGKKLIFFKEMLASNQEKIESFLADAFGKKGVVLRALFTGVEQSSSEVKTETVLSLPSSKKNEQAPVHSQVQRASVRNNDFTGRAPRARGASVVDISDKDAWPQATLLQRYFPGTITEREIRG